MDRTLVIALGGNALSEPGGVGTYGQQAARLAVAVTELARLAREGYRLVITHGNGPQVGARMLQNELAASQVPPTPLFACVAETQGMLGLMIQQTLQNTLQDPGIPVAAVVSQVVVDAGDPAFQRPEKPVGPLYDAAEARRLRDTEGYVLRELPGGGWRRVVPSPRPLRMPEAAAIKGLLAAGALVVAGGGGGVPVVEAGGRLRGVDAVVDKDLTAGLLAREIGAGRLVILTDVPGVAVDYGTPGEQFLKEVSAEELRRLHKQGQFAAGSMGPKVEAVLDFLAHGGSAGIIGALTDISELLAGGAGTQVTPGPPDARTA